jgi:hypothetical protein
LRRSWHIPRGHGRQPSALLWLLHCPLLLLLLQNLPRPFPGHCYSCDDHLVIIVRVAVNDNDIAVCSSCWRTWCLPLPLLLRLRRWRGLSHLLLLLIILRLLVLLLQLLWWT